MTDSESVDSAPPTIAAFDCDSSRYRGSDSLSDSSAETILVGGKPFAISQFIANKGLMDVCYQLDTGDQPKLGAEMICDGTHPPRINVGLCPKLHFRIDATTYLSIHVPMARFVDSAEKMLKAKASAGSLMTVCVRNEPHFVDNCERAHLLEVTPEAIPSPLRGKSMKGNLLVRILHSCVDRSHNGFQQYAASPTAFANLCTNFPHCTFPKCGYIHLLRAAATATQSPPQYTASPKSKPPHLPQSSVSAPIVQETVAVRANPPRVSVIETIWQDMGNAFRALLAAPELGAVLINPKATATEREPYDFTPPGFRSPVSVDQLEWFYKGPYTAPARVQIHLPFTSPAVFTPSVENPNGNFLQLCESLPMPTVDPVKEFREILTASGVMKDCFPEMVVQELCLWRTQEDDAFATATITYWPMPKKSADLCVMEVLFHPL